MMAMMVTLWHFPQEGVQIEDVAGMTLEGLGCWYQGGGLAVEGQT